MPEALALVHIFEKSVGRHAQCAENAADKRRIGKISERPYILERAARISFERFGGLRHEPNPRRQSRSAVYGLRLPNEINPAHAAKSFGFPAQISPLCRSARRRAASAHGAQRIRIDGTPPDIEPQLAEPVQRMHHEIRTVIGIIEIKNRFHRLSQTQSKIAVFHTTRRGVLPNLRRRRGGISRFCRK